MVRSKASREAQSRTLALKRERGLRNQRDAIIMLKQAIRAERGVDPWKMTQTQLLTRLALRLLEGRA